MGKKLDSWCADVLSKIFTNSKKAAATESCTDEERRRRIAKVLRIYHDNYGRYSIVTCERILSLQDLKVKVTGATND